MPARDTETFRRLLEFELGPARATQETYRFEWGRSLLCPDLPLVWDANFILLEQPGMTVAAVRAAGDEALADFAHRTVITADLNEGARLAKMFDSVPGWEIERNVFLIWSGDAEASVGEGVSETYLADLQALRRNLISDEFPSEMVDREETTDQLLEWERRQGLVCGDRWFVAPAKSPASACCLLRREGVGQVENVATLSAARSRGYAQATITAAVAASQRAGDDLTFIVADADAWPRLFYERLGFVECGAAYVLRSSSAPAVACARRAPAVRSV